MTGEYSDGMLSIIVSTLLQIGDRVMEVSGDHVITNIWDRQGVVPTAPAQNYVGRKITDLRNDNIVRQCDELIKDVFVNGENRYIEYSTIINENPIKFEIRILNCHPDKNYLLIVAERLPSIKDQEVIEDKWKLAMDAAGDGMWDVNMETGKIFFSHKWHDIFGYESQDFLTSSDWGAKIHPEDLVKAQKISEEYLAGKTPAYVAEMRYLCKDGTYKWILSRGVVVSRDADGKPLRFIGTHTDINDLKIAEDKYYNTAQLLAKLINNLQSAIMLIDEHWKIVFVNQMFSEMYANDGNEVTELVGLDMRKNLETRKLAYKDPEKFYDRTIDIFNKKEIVLNEEWELTDGRFLSRDYIPLSLGGNNKGGIWKFKDVTDQKNVEKRFEEQRLFYERILHNIPADIAVFDSKHKYLFVNRNAFKNEELRKWMIGKTDEEYAKYSNRPRSFVEARFALYDGAYNGKCEVKYIEQLISKEGKAGHHLRLVRPVFYENGEFEFLMAYGLEITDLVTAQEELKTSNDTFSSAFDYSGIGMALLGLDGRWLNVNKVLCDLTGYTKEELLQRTYHEITYPEDDEIDRPLINDLLKKEITTYTVEKRYVSKYQKIILVSLTVSLVWNGDGTPKFFIAQVVDITQTKELENQIMRKNSDLEITRISLVNKISQLEELSHIIAHNLRGPAGNIKTFSDVLLDKKKYGVASKNILGNAFSEEEVIGFISESSNSLMNSLSTLMEIAEIKLNKEITNDNCDVADIINSITNQLTGFIFEKHATVTLHLEIEFINYPKAYLENILYNLISNALKYCQPGIAPQIDIYTRKYGEKIQVAVKDNGLGIDLDLYGDKVFKLNQVFHSGYDSKGVGLYITKTQIESLGGGVELISKVGEGCEFIVTL